MNTSAIALNSGPTYALGLGDFNSDGNLDVVIGSTGANQLFIGDGAGGFVEDTSSAIAVGSQYTYALAVGDVNGDGSLDVVVGNTGHNQLFIGDGGGGFVEDTGSVLAVGSADTRALALCDANGDASGVHGTHRYHIGDPPDPSGTPTRVTTQARASSLTCLCFVTYARPMTRPHATEPHSS